MMEIEVAQLTELEDGAGRVRRAGRKAVALFKVADKVFATDASCPHRAGPMAEGVVSVERLEVVCPWHRFRFDLNDGRCVASPDRASLPVYPVRISDGKVFVTIDEKDFRG